MLVSEEEAKERWCPVATNEQPTEWQACCIGARCMAWRWQPLQADQPFMDAVKARTEETGETMSKATKYVRAHLAELGLPDKPYRGICGLAGALLK